MQSIRNLEYQQCRICYDSTNNLQLLTSFVESSPLMADKTYAQLLLEVCNINVVNDKPLGCWPQFVCLGCSRKLKLAYDFIQHTHKINKLLQSIADLLLIRSDSNFIEKPALDIPLEIKVEKDDLDSPSTDRKFLYSPIEVELTKPVSTVAIDEMSGSFFSCIDNASKGYKTNKVNDKNNSEHLKEVYVPNSIEFVSSDFIIKDDLEKFHRNIIDNMGNTNYNDDSDVEYVDDTTLCTPENHVPPAILRKDYECSECKRCFSSSWTLKNHKRFRHELKEVKAHCGLCSQDFARPDSYKRHMKTVHSKRKTLKKKKSIKKVPKSNKTVQHLRSEKIKINKKDDDSCNICKKRFINRGRLVRHIRYTHISEEEKIKCTICGNKFARPDNYQSHMKRMHDIDSFHCKKCDRSFALRSHLYRHERNMHERK